MTYAKSDQLAETVSTPAGARSNDAEEISLELAKSPSLTSATLDVASPPLDALGHAAALPPTLGAPEPASEALRCLDDDEVLEYREGRSTPTQRGYIHAHLDLCAACRELVYLVLRDADRDADSAPLGSLARVTTFTRNSLVSGRYRIERFVAKSGMGEVYEALDTLREKRVALKTVLCTSSDDPRAVRALTSEVEHALLVSHANVCRVYELGEHRNPGSDEPPVRYLTMEFIEGETLGRQIRRGTLALDDVRVIALQLLGGLAAAHARGVLHLDFKSDNVMLRSGASPPEALIMDFGLSRTRGLTSALHPSEQELRGTPGYMAPEQLECHATSRATDVYAFGIVLFEMLVNQLPFQADSLGGLLLKQLRTRPALPSTLRAGLAPALDAFVLRCLQRDPTQRFPDAARALEALERIAVWQAAPLGASRRSAPRRTLAVILLLALLFLGIGLLQRLSGDPQAVRAAAGRADVSTAAPIEVASQPLSAEPHPDRGGELGAPVPPLLEPVPTPPAPSPPAKQQRARAPGTATAAPLRRAPPAGAGGSGTNPAEITNAPAANSQGEPWRHIPPGGFWVPEPSEAPEVQKRP